MVLKKRIQDFFIFGFATYGILWTIAESFGAFFENHKPEGLLLYLCLIFISIGVGGWRSWPRNIIEIPVQNSDSIIEITFGDIFKNTKAVVIPVNEFFDGLLGDHVSENSLHGQFIKNILGSNLTAFNELTDESLEKLESQYIERPTGRKNKYPIGTTIVVEVNHIKYFLSALSKTDVNTLKASATIHEMWDALAGIWECLHHYSNGNIVKIPLLGSGLSGIGLPAKNLIEIILISFFYYTKRHKIANKVVLVLPQTLKHEIDLLTLKKRWS